MTKRRVLVAAYGMKNAQEAAAVLFKGKPGYTEITPSRLDTSEDAVELVKFGTSLGLRKYDLIIIVQQKKLLGPYSNYLTFHLEPTGRFERYSE
jgi:hypothetical protein